MIKRLLDILFSIILLAVLLPVFLLLCWKVRRSLGVPIFFRQVRPGKSGRPFLMFKFRTMVIDSESNFRALSDAERLTPFGAWLRSTSLDELPELWNVLKGDMSLVGPRPLLMQYLDRYTPRQARRHEVRPGITGWAQVNGRNAISWEEKFELDVWYVDNRSLWLDIRILVMTVLTVVRREGISAAAHATTPEFLGSAEQRSGVVRKP